MSMPGPCRTVHLPMVSNHTQILPQRWRRIGFTTGLRRVVLDRLVQVLTHVGEGSRNFSTQDLQVPLDRLAQRRIKGDRLLLLIQNPAGIDPSIDLMNREAGLGYALVNRPDNALRPLERRQPLGMNIQRAVTRNRKDARRDVGIAE